MNREKIKRTFPFLTNGVRWGKRRITELKSLPRHIERRIHHRKSSGNKITVVFICQYIPAWSKNKQLYETLKKDRRFHPVLLCIPNRVSANRLINIDDLSNDTYEYYKGHGYTEAVNALIGKNKWFDLKAIHPDYVIYNRYDRPMPLAYTSSVVSKYAKVCLIIYGSALLRYDERVMDKLFISNTYCFFAESSGIQKEFRSWNKLLCTLRLSKAVCCGIPAVENAYKAQNDTSYSWAFSNSGYRVIYAPRWTLDPAWGGSTFMKYKDTFIKLADSQKGLDILLRPHPLMFDHFVAEGILSSEELADYREQCDLRPNISIDAEKEYLATFWNSDLLICDYSSMLIEYYVTGKPIIYLTYSKQIEYTDQMQAMLDGCYLVDNETDLITTINNLMNGIDPLASRRKEVVEKELISHSNVSASENMKKVLLADLAK